MANRIISVSLTHPADGRGPQKGLKGRSFLFSVVPCEWVDRNLSRDIKVHAPFSPPIPRGPLQGQLLVPAFQSSRRLGSTEPGKSNPSTSTCCGPFHAGSRVPAYGPQPSLHAVTQEPSTSPKCASAVLLYAFLRADSSDFPEDSLPSLDSPPWLHPELTCHTLDAEAAQRL